MRRLLHAADPGLAFYQMVAGSIYIEVRRNNCLRLFHEKRDLDRTAIPFLSQVRRLAHE